MSFYWYHLVDAVCIKASGRDARRYLNNRLSNDLRTIAAGESLQAAALTAQGRVECLFTVFAESGELFYLVADSGNRQDILAVLGKFVVADRISLEDIGAAGVFLHVAGSRDVVTPVLASLGGSCYVRTASRLGVEGVDLLIVGVDAHVVLERFRDVCGAALSTHDYTLLRCKQGQPVFPDEVNDRVILTECGMRHAVSFSKGCYVGQEVIERSDAIGKLPRRLERIRLSGVGEVPKEAPVENHAGESIGKVVTAVSDSAESLTYVFALLKSGSYSIGDTVSTCGRSGEILSMEHTAI